ncbi:MAG: PKD domain-containing protein [Bacteroidia bacterium]
MKKTILIISGIFALSYATLAQSTKSDGKSGFITCTDFHITKPLTEIFGNNTNDIIMVNKGESEDRESNRPQKFKKSVKDGPEYGNDPATIQTEMGKVPGKSPIANWAGQVAGSFYPMDPVGAAGPNHYVQMINATTFKVFNKSTGAAMLTGILGNLWSPALTYNDGDPIVLYDKAADRWFLAQFGDNDGAAGNKIHIAISTSPDPTGSYYTYTFTSPAFPDYLKFGVWQDGYYMTSNQAQKVFVFERTAMLAGSSTARSVYQSFSPPNAGYFFVPLPGDAGDGVLPPAGTPCPIFAYSDNGWGAGYSDAVNIYKVTTNWVPATPTETIASAGTVPTAAFDATYDPSWNDCPQPGTTMKLDGIGGVCMFRAQWKTWSGYNTVVLNWGVKISATQRSIKWCELRQNQSTGVWSMYQEGIYTPDAATRWMGSIAMDNNGSIALCYLKSDATSIYPGLYYTGRRSCDPLGTLPITETVAKAGTGSQTVINRDGDYAETWLDPDGITFWHTGLYMGGPSGGSAARTQIYSFQIAPCAAVVPVANFSGTPTTICAGSSVNFTDLSTNTPTSWTWTFPGGTPATSTLQNPVVVYNTPGTYSVTLTATNSAGSSTPVTMTNYITVNAIPATPTASNTGPFCVGSTISLSTPTVAGATYAWTGPSAFSSTSQNPTRPSATAAMAGTYSVTVTVGGCTSLAGTTTVVVTTPPVATFSYTGSPYCKTAANPSPTFSGGGVAGTFSSTAGLVFVSTSTGQVNLSASTAGTYTVTNTVAAAGGCAAVTATTTITITAPPVATFSYTGSPFCKTAANPSPTFSGGGVAGTFSSTAGLVFVSTTTGQVNLSASTAGTYTVTNTIAAAGGCAAVTATATITINALPTVNVPPNSSICAGAPVLTTSFSTVPAGGTFTWTNSNTAIGLAASGSGNVPAFTATNPGTTAITATITVIGTVAGCASNPTTYTITVNPTPIATFTSSANQCLTGNSFSFTNTGSSGVGFTYSWTFTGGTPGSSTVDSPTGVTFAAAGTHNITHTITSTAGCIASTSTTVTVFPSPTALAVTTAASACTTPTGTITIGTVTGGTGPFTYSVNGSPYSGTTSYTALAAGTYPVIVKDANGCMFTTSAIIGNTSGPTALAVTNTNETCGSANGTITIGTVTGGTSPYTYSINGGAFTSTTTYTGEAAGMYSVVVQDAGGCIFTTSTTITNTAGPTALAVTSTNSTCGGTDGTATIGAVTGGTSAYTYSFNGSPFTSTTNYTGLSAGTYPVIVKDANGCTFTTSVIVGNTGSTPATPTISQAGLVLTSSSATGNQWYLNGIIIAGATGQTYTATANGTYTVVVTTGGCSSATSASVVITNVGINEAVNPYMLSIYPNPNDGNFSVTFNSAVKSSYKLELYNALGQIIFRDDINDFTGTYTKKLSVTEYGKGVYTITLTNSKNETVKKIIVY